MSLTAEAVFGLLAVILMSAPMAWQLSRFIRNRLEAAKPEHRSTINLLRRSEVPKRSNSVPNHFDFTDELEAGTIYAVVSFPTVLSLYVASSQAKNPRFGLSLLSFSNANSLTDSRRL